MTISKQKALQKVRNQLNLVAQALKDAWQNNSFRHLFKMLDRLKRYSRKIGFQVVIDSLMNIPCKVFLQKGELCYYSEL